MDYVPSSEFAKVRVVTPTTETTVPITEMTTVPTIEMTTLPMIPAVQSSGEVLSFEDLL